MAIIPGAPGTQGAGHEQGLGDMMIFRKSISASFIAAVFLVLLAAQSIGAIVFTLHIRSAFFEELQTRMTRAADIMASVAAYPLLSFDFALIDTYMEEVAKDEEITSIFIYNVQGKVVREKIKVEDSELASFNPFLYKKTLKSTVPVISGGAKIGEIAVHFSAKSVNENINKSIVIVLLFQILVLVLVGLVLAYLFNRNIKRPVSIINSAIEKITAGDLTAPVPDLGEHEIGSIAKGVAFLEQRLSATVSKINTTAQDVSAAMRKVEHTYRIVGEGITKQMDEVKEIVRAVSIANKSQKEISDSVGKLLDFSTENVTSLLEMKASSEEIASQTQRLFRATEESFSTVSELSQTSKSIASSSGGALSAVEDTSSSVEELSVSVKEVGVFAVDSSKIAETVKEITSGDGMMSVVNAVEGMNGIADQVKMSYDIFQRLGTRSVDIEKVLSVIRDVTEQTNLLSLNAAILAAQAGEYGKSFSVVADEIRALSERTSASTLEIGGIVKTIRKDIRDAIGSIDTTRIKVDDGNGLVVKVGEVLREILHASVKSSDMTKAIEHATGEQAIGLRQVKEAIENIRKMMNSVAKSTKEQEGALSYLLDGFSEVKEVAEVSKRGAEEQAEGSRVISKNIEHANERLQQISEGVARQKKLNDQILSAVDHINAVGSSTVGDMDDVSESLKILYRQIETLKQEMAAFRIS